MHKNDRIAKRIAKAHPNRISLIDAAYNSEDPIERRIAKGMLIVERDGGPGSGNFNHGGRPGKVGGSAEGSGSSGSSSVSSSPSYKKLNEAFGELPVGYQKSGPDLQKSFYQAQINNNKKKAEQFRRDEKYYTEQYQSGAYLGKSGERQMLDLISYNRKKAEEAESKAKNQEAAFNEAFNQKGQGQKTTASLRPVDPSKYEKIQQRYEELARKNSSNLSYQKNAKNYQILSERARKFDPNKSEYTGIDAAIALQNAKDGSKVKISGAGYQDGTYTLKYVSQPGYNPGYVFYRENDNHGFGQGGETPLSTLGLVRGGEYTDRNDVKVEFIK